MSISQNSFFIHFSAKDVENFNTVLANFLQKRILNRELLEFKVKRVQDTVTIQLPCDTESLSFIADIIKELDSDYTILCAPKQSKNTESSASNSIVQNEVQNEVKKSPIPKQILEETEELDVSEELPEETEELDVSEELPEETEELDVSEELPEETDNFSISEGSNALSSPSNISNDETNLSKEIKNYILSLSLDEEFSNKQIQAKFPLVKTSYIAVLLSTFKRKGIISSVSRGMYKRN